MNNIDIGHLFFGFEGRINRAQIWLGFVLLWAIDAVVGAVAGFTSNLYYLVSFVVLWPYLAISVKRWHDRNKSGWWVLIWLIPVIGWIWALIELGFLLGTDGPNQYGPDPLAVGAPETA
jgi:uncharacterized membrane protein YhaH (DUF805 family)